MAPLSGIIDFRLTSNYYYNLVDIFLIYFVLLFLISFHNYPPFMPNTRRGREPLIPYDHELERTLRNMNRNMGINDDDPNQKIPAPVYVHGQFLPDAPG